MKSTIKDQTKETLHKLKSSFNKVFGKQSDPTALEAEGSGKKISGKDNETIG